MGQGSAKGEAVRGLLARRLKDSTVRAVLGRLEQKGYVSHRIEGRSFAYLAAERRGQVAAKAIKYIVDRLCNGSVDEVLIGMMDEGILDRKQLLALANRIERAKRRRA
jgi:BlaI family penicillinase repressor